MTGACVRSELTGDLATRRHCHGLARDRQDKAPYFGVTRPRRLTDGFLRRAEVKIRKDAVRPNKAIYLARGAVPECIRNILGLWIENTEGINAKLRKIIKSRGHSPAGMR
jgi:hypothetical protein